MGLWLKQDDGSLVPVGGGSGGGEVLTGDPQNPPADWTVGQLLYDGVEDGGGTAWNPLYESFSESGPFEFSTNNAFTLDAADVDDEVAAAAAPGPVEPPLVRTWTNTNSFAVAFRIEYQGFMYGSGSRASYTKIVLRGDGVTDASSPTCRNWGGMADPTTEVNQGVNGFATCKVEAGATVTWELEAYEDIEGSFHTLKWLVFSMGCVPLDSTLLAGGSGGDGGPHDHDEYLPLTGGTVTGDLGVDGVLRLNGASESHISNSGSAGREILQIRATSEITTGAGINLYGSGDATNADRVLFYTSNEVTQALEADRSARFYGDIQVDGTITTGPSQAVFFGGNWENARINSAATAGRHYIVFGNAADGAQINLYGMGDGTSPGNILFYAGQADGGGSRTVGRWDGPTGKFIAYRDAEVRGCIKSGGGGGQTAPSYGFEGDTEGLGLYGSTDTQWLRLTAGGLWRVQVGTDQVIIKPDLLVQGTITGTLAFGIVDGIDTRDVLERAETATMPAVDDEGVATTDAEVESVTVNEVVTALLAKVKQLSARIEELEGN